MKSKLTHEDQNTLLAVASMARVLARALDNDEPMSRTDTAAMSISAACIADELERIEEVCEGFPLDAEIAGQQSVPMTRTQVLGSDLAAEPGAVRPVDPQSLAGKPIRGHVPLRDFVVTPRD